MSWQDGGVILIVGAAIAYVVRKFLLPPSARATPVTFIPVQQIKSRSTAKSDPR